MRRILTTMLLGVLALLPMAAGAQQPRGYYDDQDGRYQDGYYDHTGRWHQGQNPYRDGYFDDRGRWHAYADEGGYYDQYGNWVPNRNTARDRYASEPYGRARGNSRYGGPQRWTYNEKGRAESLDVAARNLAQTTANVMRDVQRRASYRDAAALEALRRLDESALHFSRILSQRQRGDAIDQAYAQLVDSFLFAQSRFGARGPDATLANRFHVLASAMGRLDKRYMGSRAFNGRNPSERTHGYSQQYPYRGDGRQPSGVGAGRTRSPYPY